MSRVPDSIVVVFDEAYFEFLDDPPDTLRFVRDGRNVVVLRTFSKIHGLAGLRIGYAIAPPEMIEVLHKTQTAIQREQHRTGRRDRGAR